MLRFRAAGASWETTCAGTTALKSTQACSAGGKPTGALRPKRSGVVFVSKTITQSRRAPPQGRRQGQVGEQSTPDGSE